MLCSKEDDPLRTMKYSDHRRASDLMLHAMQARHAPDTYLCDDQECASPQLKTGVCVDLGTGPSGGAAVAG